MHPNLGSCSFGRVDMHFLKPLRAEPMLTTFQIQMFHTGTRGGKKAPLLFFPPKNRRGGTMEQESRKERDGPHYRRSSCFPHRAGAPETRQPGEHGGREGGSTTSGPGYLRRPDEEGRQDLPRETSRHTRRQSAEPEADLEYFFPPTHPNRVYRRFTLIYEPIA